MVNHGCQVTHAREGHGFIRAKSDALDWGFSP